MIERSLSGARIAEMSVMWFLLFDRVHVESEWKIWMSGTKNRDWARPEDDGNSRIWPWNCDSIGRFDFKTSDHCRPRWWCDRWQAWWSKCPIMLYVWKNHGEQKRWGQIQNRLSFESSALSLWSSFCDFLFRSSPFVFYCLLFSPFCACCPVTQIILRPDLTWAGLATHRLSRLLWTDHTSDSSRTDHEFRFKNENVKKKRKSERKDQGQVRYRTNVSQPNRRHECVRLR